MRVNTSDVSTPVLSEDGMTLPEGEPATPATVPARPEPATPATVPARPEPATRTPGWSAGRITALVIGVFLALVSVSLLGAGGVGLWTDLTKRDGAGYVTTGTHHFSTAGSALITERIDLGSGGVSWLYPPALLDQIRIRVTPANPGPPLFVGIGPSAEVDRYLAGVGHSLITDFWGNGVEAVAGGTPGSAPGTQGLWVATSTGPGPRILQWEAAGGTWTVVVMHADGSPGIDVVGADLGARMPALPWISLGFLVGGAAFAVGAGFLIVGAVRQRRRVATV
jgi:hypothetical protein